MFEDGNLLLYLIPVIFIIIGVLIYFFVFKQKSTTSTTGIIQSVDQIQPVILPMIQSLVQPTAQSVAQPVVQSIAQPVVQSIAQPVVQSIAQPVVQSIAQPVVQSVAQPVVQSIAQPVVQSIAQPVVQSVAQPPPKPYNQSDAQAIAQSISQQLTYYSFDTSTVNGTSVQNLASNIYDATLTANGLIDNTNQHNGTGCLALTQGDSSKYLNLPQMTTGANGLSISLWFKIPPNFTQGNLWLLDLTSTPQSDNIIIQVRKDNNLEVDVFNNGNQYYNVFRNSPIVYDNTWKHLVWTISPSGTWSVYINNTKLTSSAGSSTYPTPMTRTRCRVGRAEWGSYIDGFVGYIDDYRIYNKELTANEVAALYSL